MKTAVVLSVVLLIGCSERQEHWSKDVMQGATPSSQKLIDRYRLYETYNSPYPRHATKFQVNSLVLKNTDGLSCMRFDNGEWLVAEKCQQSKQ